MDVEDFTSRVRDHYLEQFRSFVHQQRQCCIQGSPEVKLLLSDQSKIYRRLYCVDFIKNDDAPEIVELYPDRFLKFEPFTGTVRDASLLIDHLRWDDVEINHDLPKPPQIDQWFERWFDPEDKRHDQDGEFSGIIHSLLVRQGNLSIDFGSAATSAFWEVLDLLAREGATQIRVGSSRAEVEEP